MPEARWGSVPTSGPKHGNILDDPFVVLESSSTPGTSSGVFTDPLEEIGKFSKSQSARVEPSSRSAGTFDDLDPLSTIGKSAPSSSPGRGNRGMDGIPSRSATPESAATRELMGNSSFRYSESNAENKVPLDDFQEPTLFDPPNVSSDFQKSFGQTAPPQYYETDSQNHMSKPSEGEGHESDDIWLTVSEIPLFTQPSNAPPPSRPPPPVPRQGSRSETGSFSSSLRKKGNDYSSPSHYSQRSQSPKPARAAAKGPPVSQFDELEDFAMGRSRNNFDESADLHSGVETNPFSSAAASAAAMKDAMDKAEAKFRQAKEVREREYAKVARNKESGQLEKDEQDGQEREFRESQERFERERIQKEEEEREQRRLERERLREIEREKARQAVERATREARERAATEARERAAAEARLRAERAAVDKVNAEARGRAERVAVQRAQAEARERAAAEAKERAEKAAAEARERAAAAEAKEKEMRDKAAVARAEAEARRRAERAAVERAAAEARERAAAEARERAAAAAAAKMNQQKNDNDLESFFSMGRASSAPRARANTADSLFDQQFQNKGGSEAAKRTTSSSSGASSNIKKASSTTNFDDLSSIFGAAPSSGEFQEVEGETEERRRARLDRHQRTQERAAKALAEKNQRDLQAQREQEERHRIAETLDTEIKRWAASKEGNLRALLSTLQYVLWPECGWQPVSLTDLITGASVKKVYRKATLCIHPDKVQQKGATLQQKYIAEKVFDLLKVWILTNHGQI
ncbi:Auxilin-related protein 2 [Sesamum angolense]|uniref:Auxilin-related protein 2 n=1 Tax=Sesamum angolense TaxID=2727404 RepID=A0AAE1XC73_9LAMI|nr:Auxilin-related protein 2 [Sesamum angolense]